MEFILWTLVWFGLYEIPDIIGYIIMGVPAYTHWKNKEYNFTVIFIYAFLKWFLYIYLYLTFIK